MVLWLTFAVKKLERRNLAIRFPGKSDCFPWKSEMNNLLIYLYPCILVYVFSSKLNTY